ncbi:GntR family transcriptional regulator [Roseomonas sp. M0104]|uniref:GntR family transcriptional regulator n=1 Tax=Teichococcus coralli TaxID=2545983 RepID=A0A845B6N8_9PROT|nr:GntR family transcriptional regulator [Pseudoroseomonas coralli]MXP61764.1 GntR family transcriptional regulator [Pseudoroseomonas coralli]
MSKLSAAPLQPFERRPSAGEFAYGSLRETILTLALPPGAPLSRATLAESLGLSQTPVREALVRLQAEGLVEVVPSASTHVARINLASARETLFLRRALEREMVRQLAEAPPPGLTERIQAQLAAQGDLLERGDHAAFSAVDDAFHAMLYEAAGISGLWDMVQRRSGHLARLRRLHLPAPGKARTVLQEHGALADAILAGDAVAAEVALRRHLSDTFGRLEEIRAAHPGYFAAG